MATVRDLLTDTLAELGVLDPTEAIDSANGATSLRALNRMLGSWNLQKLLNYTVTRNVFTIPPGSQTRTIGIGGNFATATPVLNKNIHSASVLVGDTESFIKILTDQEWQELTTKSSTADQPLSMWPSGSYPLNTLHFNPIPQSSSSLVLYLEGQHAPFTSLNDPAVFPPGYDDPVIKNLAVILAPIYGVQPNPVTVMEAQKTLAMIKRANWQPSYRSADPVLLRRHF